MLFVPGEGLVVDEAFFGDLAVDDAKALVYLAKPCDVSCRHADGHIPKGTPRAYSTNWTWGQFWPRQAYSMEHKVAVERRVLWINIGKDVRKDAKPGDACASADSRDKPDPALADAGELAAAGGVPDDDDVFGFGGGFSECA